MDLKLEHLMKLLMLQVVHTYTWHLPKTLLKTQTRGDVWGL